jgi:hypothetical protein
MAGSRGRKKKSELVPALLQGRDAHALRMIEDGCDLASPAPLGFTVLHAAALGNCPVAAAALLEREVAPVDATCQPSENYSDLYKYVSIHARSKKLSRAPLEGVTALNMAAR